METVRRMGLYTDRFMSTPPNRNDRIRYVGSTAAKIPLFFPYKGRAAMIEAITKATRITTTL